MPIHPDLLAWMGSPDWWRRIRNIIPDDAFTNYDAYEETIPDFPALGLMDRNCVREQLAAEVMGYTDPA